MEREKHKREIEEEREEGGRRRRGLVWKYILGELLLHSDHSSSSMKE